MFKKQHKNANLAELHNNYVHTFAGMWNELVEKHYTYAVTVSSI